MASETFNLNLLITITETGHESITQGLQKVEGAAATTGQQAGQKFSQGLSSQALLGLQGLAAAVGGFRIAQFGKSAIEDAIQFSRANAELAAQIQATGDISGASVPQIDRLASSIESTQAIYSGTVKQGAALLLTFQEVRNEAGKGNDIFNRTLGVAAAVSNVFNKDITSSVLQVGRALENPQAGIQALSRSGLTLEKHDRERILNLAKQDDLLGAQKALLDALESRTLKAGEAAAKADPLQQLQVQFEKFKVTLGKDLTPEAKVALAAIEGLTGAFSKLPAPVRAVTETLLLLGIAYLPIKKLFDVVNSFKPPAAAGKQAATDAEAQAKATGDAAAQTGILTEEQTRLGAAVTKNIAPVTDLNAVLAAIGEGAAGITAIIEQLGALSEALAGTVDEVAGLKGALTGLGVGGTGLVSVEEQLAALNTEIATTEGELAGLKTQFATLGLGAQFGSLGADLAPLDAAITETEARLAALKTQLATLGTGGAVGVVQVESEFAGFDAAIAKVDGQLAGLKGQIATLGESGVGLTGVDAEFVVLDRQIAETEAQLAGLKAQLATLATGAQFGGVTGGGAAFAALDAQITETEAQLAGLKTQLATLGVGGTGIAAVDGELVTLVASLKATETQVVALKVELATLGAGGGAGVGVVEAELTALQAKLGQTEAEVVALKLQLSTLGAAGVAGNLGPAALELGAVGASSATAVKGISAVSAAGKVLSGEIPATTGALAAITPVGIGVGGALTALTVGIVAFSATYQGLNALVGGHHTPFDVLSRDAQRAAQDIKDVTSQGLIEHLSSGFNRTLQQDQTDIKDLNAGFKSLADSDGAPAAEKAVGQFIEKLTGLGVPISKISSLLRPALDYIAQLSKTEHDAANATDDLATALDHLAPKIEARDAVLSLADAFDQLAADQKKVSQDFADFRGTGDKAKAAAQAVVDARRGVVDAGNSIVDANQTLSDSYTHLQDAQDSVGTSLHSLQQAQEALDLYNSARGVTERALALDIIQRRVVTTPAESDQKQLDLLKFQDDNQNKQQQLQDAVTNATKGYRDALRSVEDAHRAIAKAQLAVNDAVAREVTARGKVADALRNQKQVQVDAYAAWHADQRKVEEDGNKIATQIQGFIDKFPELASSMDPWLTKLVAAGVLTGSVASNLLKALYIQLAQDRVAGLLAGHQGPAGPQGFANIPPASGVNSPIGTGNYLDSIKASNLPQVTKERLILEAIGSFSGTITSADRSLLHQFGVPGFATGGIAESHVAQIAGAGATRMWAEPETGGEAYIPLATSKRARSTEILSTVAEKFGMHVVDPKQAQHNSGGKAYFDGGVTPPSMYAVGGVAPNPGPGTSSGPEPGSVGTAPAAASVARVTAAAQAAVAGPVGRALSVIHQLTALVNVPTATLPHFDEGGIVPGLPGVPRIIVAHGGERIQTPAQQAQHQGPLVHQEISFHGTQVPTLQEIDVANRELGWRLARTGRG